MGTHKKPVDYASVDAIAPDRFHDVVVSPAEAIDRVQSRILNTCRMIGKAKDRGFRTKRLRTAAGEVIRVYRVR